MEYLLAVDRKIFLWINNQWSIPPLDFFFSLGLVDPRAIPGHTTVFVGVKLQTMALMKKGEEFSRLRGVVSVSVVTGQYDLILVVLLNEEFDLLEFYSKGVSRIKGVRSVETFVVYKDYNLKVPYVL